VTEAAIYDVADRFGVDLVQARRDHAHQGASDVLQALSASRLRARAPEGSRPGPRP
jgi:hypothetical protein